MLGTLVIFTLGAVAGGCVAVALLCALIAASAEDDQADRGDYRAGGWH